MSQTLLDNYFAVASLSLGAFGVAMCILQDRDKWIFRAFALVLFCSFLIDLTALSWAPANSELYNIQAIYSALVWLIALVCLPVFFWHYVWVLTSMTPRLPERLWLHALLPITSLVIAICVLLMPYDTQLGLFVDGHDLPTGVGFYVGMAGELLSLLALFQWGAYFVAIFLRLRNHNERIKQYFASTERRELTWIRMLGVILALYWITNAFETLVEIGRDGGLFPNWLENTMSLVLLFTVLLWGLRQRSVFESDEPLERETSKYENSALSDEMATRLERKLRRAMEHDKLHHNPDLSLWALANHTGASPNYISQTLNERIGENFFDFVNRYRIEEAQSLLMSDDATVLNIAYNVGFNSRSSFYTAFRKVTGQTPSAYRQSMSVPAQ